MHLLSRSSGIDLSSGRLGIAFLFTYAHCHTATGFNLAFAVGASLENSHVESLSLLEQVKKDRKPDKAENSFHTAIICGKLFLFCKQMVTVTLLLCEAWYAVASGPLLFIQT